MLPSNGSRVLMPLSRMRRTTVVIGAPGSGKTVTLSRLAYGVASTSNWQLARRRLQPRAARVHRARGPPRSSEELLRRFDKDVLATLWAGNIQRPDRADAAAAAIRVRLRRRGDDPDVRGLPGQPAVGSDRGRGQVRGLEHGRHADVPRLGRREGRGRRRGGPGGGAEPRHPRHRARTEHPGGQERAAAHVPAAAHRPRRRRGPWLRQRLRRWIDPRRC